MSFILNALQKSETERREREQAPNLLTVQTPSDDGSGPRKKPTIWQWLSMLLLLGVLLLGYRLLQQSAPTTAAPQVPTLDLETPKPITNSAHLEPTATEPKVSAALTTSLPSSEPEKIGEPDKTPNRILPKPLADKPSIANAEVNDLYNPSSDIEQTETPDTPVALTESQRELAKRAQQLKSEMAEAQVPAIHNMPLAIQNRLPKMVYSAHIYSSDADSGFAIINDRRRYRGDQIAPGLLVVSVIGNGVVLTFEGYTFRLDAMKNWPLE